VRNIGRVVVNISILGATALGFAVGCASKESAPSAGASGGSGGAAGSLPEAAATGPRVPLSVYDAALPSTGDYCSFLVAAECDGNEDCENGQTCCGILNGGALRYDSIKCQDTCEAPVGGTRICHPGDPCPMPGDAGVPEASAPLCRRSTVLPAYLAICGTPNALIPSDFVGKPKAPHQINCGSDLVCGSGEKCCVLGNWDAVTQATSTRTGYCSPAGERCDCTKAPKSDGGG
jgi:hypothetical protein